MTPLPHPADLAAVRAGIHAEDLRSVSEESCKRLRVVLAGVQPAAEKVLSK